MDADGDYFNSIAMPFELNTETDEYTTFTFYMPENRKSALKDVPDYASRDESDHEELAGSGKPGQE